jgi:phosphoribosylanthranilate isomerase
MSLWIKICANTTLEDTLLAVEAGADAVGFVFAPSPRRVTAAEVAAIVQRLPTEVEKIGVFVDASLEEIYSTVRECGLTGVQLHSDADPELPTKLRNHLGPGLRILRVVHYGANAAEQAAALAQEANVDAVLVDSRTATAVGGTGIPFDWAEARKSIFGKTVAGKSTKLIAAGGLNLENVAEAIATLRPWGLDVATGVEELPGQKNPAKVWAFIARARAAFRKTESASK